MKKIFSTMLFAACVFGWGTAVSQCTINTSNTTTGITPTNADDTLTQGVAYSQTLQVYVPSTYLVATVDSVHIDSIKGAPNGGTWVYNPHDGDGFTVTGGNNGAICFNATTSSPVGNYPLTFYGNIYVTEGGTPATLPLSTLAADFSYSFNVKAAASSGGNCDSLFNLSSVQDTPTVYLADTTLTAGYISGNNEYGDLIKAEGFAATIGDYVNSATFYAAIVTINPTDSNSIVTIGVWDNTGTALSGNAGAPGNMIDSVHITLAQLAQSVTSSVSNQALVGLLVNFHGGVALTTDTFYVGIVLPTTTGDTVALYQNTVFGVGGNAWEYELNYVTQDGSYIWNTYNDDWGFTAAGNYIIADICSSPSAGVPVAAFTAPSTACASAPVTFTDASTSNPAPSAWGWNFGDGASSSSQNPTHAYAAAGNYTINEYVTNNLGGVIQTFVAATASITVNADPSASVAVTDASSSSSDNGSVTVTASGGATPYTYSWNGGQTSASVTGLAPNAYTVTVTDANSCTTTASASVYISGIINLNNSVTVSIYPNPASDVLNLVWSQSINAEVSVIDLNGNVISTLTTSGNMKTAYDIHNLAAGAYILRITDKTNNQQQSTLFSKF